MASDFPNYIHNHNRRINVSISLHRYIYYTFKPYSPPDALQ